jgi:hypothetical protein
MRRRVSCRSSAPTDTPDVLTLSGVVITSVLPAFLFSLRAIPRPNGARFPRRFAMTTSSI